MLGLAVQEIDETKSQIAHGETVREVIPVPGFVHRGIEKMAENLRKGGQINK
jgi:ornithine carbamoyltransferase